MVSAGRPGRRGPQIQVINHLQNRRNKGLQNQNKSI
nr:MAG TPA: hypothetical protein [Caudoviricetes sp.]